MTQRWKARSPLVNMKDESEKYDKIRLGINYNFCVIVDQQMYSAMSFAIMLLVIGIPLWWKTTEVYRVSLPYSEIYELAKLEFKINMTVHLVCIDPVKGGDYRNKLQEYTKHLGKLMLTKQ